LQTPSKSPPQPPTADLAGLTLARSGWTAAACVLGAAWVVWWLRVACANGHAINTFLNFDALMYWLPLLREAAAQWRHGTVPLWNPYQALGTPLLATLQAGVLYPLNVLYLCLDPGHAWLVTVITHHVIAGLGLYALARTLTLSPAAALVGSTAYLFSWVFLPTLFDQPQFICLAWLPALFACTERLLTRPRCTAVARLAVVWSLQILGGHPETIAASALLLGAYVFVRTACDLPGAPRRALLGAVAAAASSVAVAGLTAVQWLPTYELVQHSVRAPGTLTVAQQIVHTTALWELLSRGPGRAPLAVAFIGLWTWQRRSVAWFFGTAAMIVAVLAAGPATPIFHLLRDLPMGSWFRAPTRLLNLWPLCIAILSAAGADTLAPRSAFDDGRRRAGLAIAGGALLLLARLTLIRRADVAQAMTAGVLFDLLPLAAVVIAARKARATVKWHRTTRVLALSPVVVLVLVSALPITVRYDAPEYVTPLQAAQLYAPQAEVFAWLHAATPARVLSVLPIADGHVWAKLGTYFEVPVLNDLEPLTLADFHSFAGALSGSDPDWSVAVFMGNVVPPHPRFDARLFNLSGVRFIVAAPNAAAPPAWFPPGVTIVPAPRDASAPGDGGRATIAENRSAAPRAFFINAGRVRAPGRNCLTSLQAPDFDPLRDLLLNTAAPPASDAQVTSSHVEVTAYAPADVRLAVESQGPGFVVVTDAFFPGWEAEVDGTTVPVLQADCFFRAVPVGAGAHSVRLRYTPRSFAVGSITSLLTAGLACVLCVTAGRRRLFHRAEPCALAPPISPEPTP